MSDEANRIIDGLGGTTAVSRMTLVPPSTVHSWRKNGIPLSRLAHLKLAAKAEGIPWPGDTEAEQSPSSDNSEDNIGGS
ncbi:carph-isopro domain-containing protein [Sphingobium sp. LSP13-1-1.1]|uniref:carph-isopro domain-containing protein n=1 Tax=Sphingobium sp. LSP13-1-1.1 TaxID=3135234 RepID=UPI003445F163